MKHAEGATVHWKRGYDLETGNNQLKKTSLPGHTFGDPSTYSSAYSYNARGAMVFLPHLKTGVSENLTRDFRDQLRKADLNTGGDVAWYAYDASGNRVRKYWDKGSVTEERIYIGAGWEVWRKKSSGTLTEERETLHVMDDQRRVALVETDTQASTTRYRFQLDDHLGTASVETDDDGGVITYEEFHPYGTTAWWARSSSTDVSNKRYRYTGKEKDEETGLSYHQARYLMTWLGRWDRPDPLGTGDGGNRYNYVSGHPSGATDRTGTSAIGLTNALVGNPAGVETAERLVPPEGLDEFLAWSSDRGLQTEWLNTAIDSSALVEAPGASTSHVRSFQHPVSGEFVGRARTVRVRDFTAQPTLVHELSHVYVIDAYDIDEALTELVDEAAEAYLGGDAAEGALQRKKFSHAAALEGIAYYVERRALAEGYVLLTQDVLAEAGSPEGMSEDTLVQWLATQAESYEAAIAASKTGSIKVGGVTAEALAPDLQTAADELFFTSPVASWEDATGISPELLERVNAERAARSNDQ